MSTDQEQAEELLRRGKYADAVTIFRNLLSNDPEDAQLRGRAGEAYRLAGNRERAFHHFHKAAGLYTRFGDVEGALRMLKAANAVSPNEPDVLFRMGECMKSLGLGRELEPVLRQIVQVAIASGDRRRVWALDELVLIYPDDLDLQVRRAQVLGEAHRIDDAVTAWKKVSARLDYRAGDFTAMLQQAASLAPDRPDIGVDLAGILLVNKKPRDALALLVPYYEKFPDHVDVLETLLKALEALKAYDKIIAARIELIKVRTKLGHRSQTLAEIAMLQKTSPSDPASLEVMAHAFATFGLQGEACRAWYAMAESADARGDHTSRDRAILLLLKNNPNHIGGLTLGARVLRAAGRPEEAASLERRLKELEVGGDSMGEIPGVNSGVGPTGPLRAQPTPVRHDDRWKSPSGSISLEDDDVLDEHSDNARPARPRSVELILPVSLVDQSEPNVEAMPIHKNPWSEGLELEVQRANAETQLRSRADLDAMPASMRPTTSATFDAEATGEQTASPEVVAEDIEDLNEVEETTSRFDTNESTVLRNLRTSGEEPDDAPDELKTTLAPSLPVAKKLGSQPLRPEEFDQGAPTATRLREEMGSKKS